MAQIIREIRVDVSQPNVFQAIVAKQLDCNSRFLKITLVDFGVKIEVPETAKVTINANRPDGKSQSFVGVANNDGTITVPLAQWMLEVAGELKCDVSVINTTDNKRLTSTDFFVNVQEAANKSTDISENPDGEIRVITPTQKIDKDSSDDEYPSAKAVYDLDNITASATGSAITIDSAKAPLQNLKLFGKTEQLGTPTPDAPVPLVSVGDSGSFEVGVYGKNLLSIYRDNHTNVGVTFTRNADNSFSLSGTCTYNVLENIGNVYLVKGTSYIVTGCASGGATNTYLIRVTDSKNTILAQDIGEGETFTATETGLHTVGIRVQQGTVTDGLTFYPMVRYATETDSTYEPCNKQTLTMPYTLRKYGTFVDSIDFAKGTITEKNYSIYIDSMSGITPTINNGVARFDVKGTPKALSYGVGMCNRFKVSSAPIGANNEDNCISGFSSGGVYFRCDELTNATDRNAWLAEHPIHFIYPLATPTETPLTETELNAYRQLLTNKGNTTILSEADMELDYYINKPNAQAIGNIHSQVNKDYLKLQQAIISTGGSTL